MEIIIPQYHIMIYRVRAASIFLSIADMILWINFLVKMKGTFLREERKEQGAPPSS